MTIFSNNPKTISIAAKNPKKALKGRHNPKHGFNPCKTLLLALLLGWLVPLAAQDQTYDVHVKCSEGGSIIVSNIPPSQWGDNPQSITEASPGDYLFFVMTPDEGYKNSSIYCSTLESGQLLFPTNVTNLDGESLSYYVMPADHVEIKAYFTKKTYTITLRCVPGTIPTLVDLPSTAPEGQTVNIEFQSWILNNPLLALKNIECVGESGNSIKIDWMTSMLFQFTMPAENVTVTVTFDVKAILTALSVSEGTLIPAFDSDVLDYTVLVDHSVDEMQISARGGAISLVSSEWKAGSISFGYEYHNIPTNVTGTVELADGENVVHINVYDIVGSGMHQTYTVTVIRLPEGTIALSDKIDNRDVINAHSGTPCNVWMYDLTLRKDGIWNPLVLPFGLATLSGTPLEGAEVRTVESASFANRTLTMDFTEPADDIIAGYPYLLRWNGGDDIISPTFANVTLSDDTQFYYSDETSLKFYGFYYPYGLDLGSGSNELYMGSDNKLHYPCGTVTLSAFRPFFMLAEPEGKELFTDMVSCEMHLGAETLTTAFPAFIAAGNWDEAANWNTNAVPAAGDQVALFADAVIPAGFEVHTAEVYLPDTVSLTIADRGQLYHTNTGVQATMEKTITAYTSNNNGWHLISYPFAGSGAVDEMPHLLAGDYDLYYYYEPRHYWRNHKNADNDFTKLEAAKGYLYSNSQEVTLGLKGTMEAGNTTVSVPLSYTEGWLAGSGIAIMNPLAGFNLVGNPFAHIVTSFTGSNVATEVYRMNETMDEVAVGTLSESNPLKPGEGFFVKATTGSASITFNDNGAKGSERSLSLSKGRITIDLLQNGLLVDRLIVKQDGEPLEKFTLRENGTKIYATQDGQDYAVVVVGGDVSGNVSTEMPVNFKAAKDGTFTLNVNIENMDLDYLHLVDHLTGADVDLLVTDGGDARHCVSTYTFTAKTTDYASRFRLVFSNDDAGEDACQNDVPFAYISNGEIRLVETFPETSQLQVIDMLGRVVVSVGDVSGNVSTTGMPSGVYVLRLVDGENVKTQKIIID